MSNLFKIIIVLLFSFNAFGYTVPKDAIIKVYSKDGKQIGKMSRKEYKVVKLSTSKTTVVTKTITKQCKTKKNRFQVKFGVGKDGVENKHKSGSYEVSETTKPIAGVSYSHKVDGDLSLGVSVHTNKTTTLDVGVDF